MTLALGLRLGEALGLAWFDIDFDAGKLTIRRALQRAKTEKTVKGTLRLVEPKSERSRRTITLPAFALSALHHARARQEQERKWAGTRWQGNVHNLVFTSTVGTPLEPRNALKRFHQLLELAELPRMHLHDLRHSAAAILIAQGVQAKAISDLSGHNAASFTLQFCGHLMEETEREVAAKMDAVFESGGGQNGGQNRKGAGQVICK